jgi:hypothetical protein
VDLEPGAADLPFTCAAVGDPSAWSVAADVVERVCGTVGDALFASSATYALPGPQPAPLTTATGVLRPGGTLLLVTDGIGDPLGTGTGEVGRFVATNWSSPVSALRFAAQVDFARRSFDDDRTALAVWLDPERP